MGAEGRRGEGEEEGQRRREGETIKEKNPCFSS